MLLYRKELKEGVMKKGLLRVLVWGTLIAAFSAASLFGTEGKVALVIGNGSYNISSRSRIP
jgi:hypothetical protein